MSPSLEFSRGYLASCGLALTMFVTTPAMSAETALYSFQGGSDGMYPEGGLIKDKTGDLFGTTAGGGGGTGCDDGSEGCGTIFRVSANGTESVLYAFQGGSDGEMPEGSLILDKKGNLYGTTSYGGNFNGTYCSNSGCGTVFKLAPNGKKTILYAFQGGSDGLEPYAGLIADTAGNLYGTTAFGGGASACGAGCGTVFKIAANGTETVLYAFQGGCDGALPTSNLIMEKTGNLYGTTQDGGCVSNTDDGTVFKLAPDGTETVLYSFKAGNDGEGPDGGLIEDKAGNLYGTAFDAGGTGCDGDGCGIVFQIAPGGSETILYSFTGGNDGANPAAGLLAGKQKLLYGTTESGGTANDGVIFSVNK